jgi:hypothetical protein
MKLYRQPGPLFSQERGKREESATPQKIHRRKLDRVRKEMASSPAQSCWQGDQPRPTVSREQIAISLQHTQIQGRDKIHCRPVLSQREKAEQRTGSFFPHPPNFQTSRKYKPLLTGYPKGPGIGRCRCLKPLLHTLFSQVPSILATSKGKKLKMLGWQECQWQEVPYNLGVGGAQIGPNIREAKVMENMWKRAPQHPITHPQQHRSLRSQPSGHTHSDLSGGCLGSLPSVANSLRQPSIPSILTHPSCTLVGFCSLQAFLLRPSDNLVREVSLLSPSHG